MRDKARKYETGEKNARETMREKTRLDERSKIIDLLHNRKSKMIKEKIRRD